MKKYYKYIVLGIASLFIFSSCGSNGVNKPEGGTNTQEANVDEGDIVKISNDGIIYKLQNDGITLTKVDNGNMKVIGYKSYISYNIVPIELYCYDSQLIIIAGYLSNDYHYSTNIEYSDVFVEYYDLKEFNTNQENPVLIDQYRKKHISFDYSLSTTRLYQDKDELLIVAKSNFYSQNCYYDEDLQIDLDNTIDLFKEYREEENIHYYYDNDSTIVLLLNLKTNVMVQSLEFINVMLKDVYATSNYIYPIFYNYTLERLGKGCYDYRNFVETSIIGKINFDLDLEGKTLLRQGSIYDRYALKEANDVLYAAYSDMNSSKVVSIDSSMNIISTLDGIAPGEEIKSVNYDISSTNIYCFITTFKRIDPLFKIDITNPNEMIMLGAYETEGFATYMKAISNDRLITIGYGGTNDVTDESMIRISLYDTSANDLKLINYVSINNIMSVEAFDNEKAIYFNDDYFGFAINLKNNGVNNDYLVFTIDENGYLTLKSRIMGSMYYDAGFRVDSQLFRRMFIKDNYLYITSNDFIYSFDINNDFTYVSKVITRIMDITNVGGIANEN